MNRLQDLSVAIVEGISGYPGEPPFHPSELYPEFMGKPISVSARNSCYAGLRDCLRLLGLDSGNFGRESWNPLRELVAPGDCVLIKPNFVMHRNYGAGPLEAVVTHPSVLRAVADYVLLALGGRGELIIGDAPQMNCDMATLLRDSGMDSVIAYLRETCAVQGVRFSFTDFREEQAEYRIGMVWKRKKLGRGDSDTVRVELGRESFMEEISPQRLYGADYDRRVTIRAHTNHRHEYWIAREALCADVVISVPKLKVHSKVGTTLNIKNMVGINTNKNHLAHYRVGSSAEGGDEFSSPGWADLFERKLCDALLGHYWALGKYPFAVWRIGRAGLGKILRKRGHVSFVYGNWHGNDTAWRMALDLNRILLFADARGILRDQPQRRYFSVVDGIVGGDGNGPLHPDACNSGALLAGFNPLAVDWFATEWMGLDPERIRMYTHGIAQMKEWVKEFSPQAIKPRIERPTGGDAGKQPRSRIKFRPAPGWKGTVEMYEPDDTAGNAESDPLPEMISQ